MWGAVGLFLKANWKPIAIGLACLAAYFLWTSWLSGVKKRAYNEGVVAEHTRWQKRIDAENQRNREIERKLADSISELGKAFAKQDQQRVIRENTHKETIREILDRTPGASECKVPMEVLDERNAIRRLGPRP